jgi:hypothetical protein
MALVFVDVEALGTSPVNGTMTEFGAVIYDPKGDKHKLTYHGQLYEGVPNPENPAVPIVGKQLFSDAVVANDFINWLRFASPGQCTLVSDNPAYDFMWMAGMFDRAGVENPFGHSGRRISDYWAGINHKWSETQGWKRFRRTPHDHNPVNDAMGNVEAFEYILTLDHVGPSDD